MVLAASVTFAVGACGTVASSPPPSGGLTSNQATAIAMPMAQSGSTSPVVFLSAKAAHYGDFRDGGLAVDPNTWVWVVVFSGTFPPHGGPVPRPGETSSPRPDQHSIMEIIDYSTGGFIQASIPSPYVADY